MLQLFYIFLWRPTYQEALEIYQKIKDDWGQVAALHFLGEAYLGRNFEIGSKYIQQSLTLAREVKDYYGEARALMTLSGINTTQAKYAEAVKYAQQAWRVAQQIENSNNRYLAQSTVLIDLIYLYDELGDHAKANEYGEIARKLARQNSSARIQENQNGEIDRLILTGSDYESRGEYIKAIFCYEQVVALAPKSSYPLREVVYLGSIGSIYLDKLNNPSKAIKYYQQQFAAGQKLPGNLDRSSGLLGLGYAYAALGDFAKAVEYFNQLLTAARKNGERSDEYIALHVLAEKYLEIGNYPKAIAHYRQLIAFEAESNINSFSALGSVYQTAHDYPEAIGAYQRVLLIAQEKRDRRNETLALEKIGELYKQQNQLELAIVFYKQSVNVYESIRKDIRQLPKEQQASYTQSVESTYRRLADLLLKQNRIMEAMQVLDLLKVQEGTVN